MAFGPVFGRAIRATFDPRAAAAIEPDDIANLSLWLRSDYGLYQDAAKTTPVTADSQSIGAWVDKAGGSITFTQATGSKKPTYKTSIVNSQPVVRADGGDILTTTDLSVTSGPKTCFAVLQRSGTSNEFLLDSQTGRLVLSTKGASTKYSWFDGTWHDSYLAPQTGFGVFSFWLGDPVQSQGEIFYNGASVGTGKYVSRALGGTTALFAIYTGTACWTGDLAELIIYNAYLTTSEREAIEAYLYQRYAISILEPHSAAYTAYVTTAGNDGTGALGNPELPFATINAALAALPAWAGIVNIGAGTFAAINDDTPTIGAAIKRNTRFQGAGRPDFNAGKTGLENGTIIKGPLWIKQDGVQLRDLGVDSGSDVCTADYAGAAQEGIRYDLWVSGGDTLQVKDTVLVNVASICQAANAAMHAMGFEGTYNLQASGLRTCFGTHGIAIKSIGATLSDLVCNGHATEGIVVKIETTKNCNNVNISNVTVNHVASGDTGTVGGLFFHWFSGTNDLHTILVDDIYVTPTATVGVQFSATTGTIRDVTVTDLTGLTTVGKDAGTITDCTVNGVAV